MSLPEPKATNKNTLVNQRNEVILGVTWVPLNRLHTYSCPTDNYIRM